MPRPKRAHEDANTVEEPEKVNKVLFRANRLLVRGSIDEATALYTKVLHDLSPGHICAFLNRSLCFIRTGHYELAATDAYRAAMAAHDLQECTLYSTTSRLQAQESYLRAEDVEVFTKENWTLEKSRYVGGGWLSCPLASLVLNEAPDPDRLNLDEKQRGSLNLRKFRISSRRELCCALEIRAVYRLAGALYRCGGGALTDAIGLLDDASAHLGALEWERMYLIALGDKIMNHISDQVEDEGDFEDGSDGLSVVRQLLNTRAVLRPWNQAYAHYNKDEPKMTDPTWISILQNWVHAAGTSCDPKIETGVSNLNEARSSVVLVANRDVRAEEMLLMERSPFNVNTHIPRAVGDSSNIRYNFCDNCAALVILDVAYKIQYREKPGLKRRDDQPLLSRTRNSTPFRLPARRLFFGVGPDEMDYDSASPRGRLAPSPPPTTKRPFAGGSEACLPVFHHCSELHAAPLCSRSCSRRQQMLDGAGLCGTNVESLILRQALDDQGTLPRVSLEGRQVQGLRDLMLLRVLADALQRDQNPLHTPQIAFALYNGVQRGVPTPLWDADKPAKFSWSFTHNIVKPLSILHRFCNAAGVDPFAQLRRTEGYVLNVLVTKIKEGLRVSPFRDTETASNGTNGAKISSKPPVVPHYTRYHCDVDPLPELPMTWQRGVTLCDEHMNQRVPGDVQETLEEASHVRIGRLNPILDMIAIADPTKGERANVRIERGDGIKVFALGPGGDDEAGPSEVAIHQGEVLLRDATYV